MHLEIILLILESVLLVFTIVLLIYSIREGTERKSLLQEVGRATRMLTRLEYFLTVTDTMNAAQKEVIGCITGRLPADVDSVRLKSVTDSIRKLTERGVQVKYLMPKMHDRLHIGFRYSQAGAEVRYSSCLVRADVRYIVADSRVTVIGVPEYEDAHEDTKKGYRLPSEGWSGILKEFFLGCWHDSVSFDDYLRYVIEHTGGSPKMLARELKLDEAAIEKFATRLVGGADDS